LNILSKYGIIQTAIEMAVSGEPPVLSAVEGHFVSHRVARS